MRSRDPRHTPFDPPSARDWILLVISLLFVAAGVLEIVRGDWRTGAITLMFFGGGALLFAGQIFTKLRWRRSSPGKVAIAGSRDIPMARGRILALVAAVGVFGLAGALLGGSMGLVLQGLCAGLALFAVGFTLALLCNWLPTPALRFEPQGLVVQRGSRRRYRADWDNIAGLSVGELARNPMILLHFHDSAAVTILPGAQRALVQREIASTQGLYGADLVIMPKLFGLDAQLLAAALQRYIKTPAARTELGAWAAVPAGT
ncbi:hypothetical protein QO010_001744 [Caulobacter ginsengisoli]|uniref:Uncharacterized protein n=1 Tax=Caulobacter ginsengisoli TaxID=400775 RepID=A0ABU0IPN7_9CAUL|nr:hypothetical protein [Caulobacter ginsengisoli]MDQ0463973.1 hypothetical protein [Caulobacter ginsengisoli]